MVSEEGVNFINLDDMKIMVEPTEFGSQRKGQRKVMMSFPSAFVVRNHGMLPRVNGKSNGRSNRLLKGSQ